MRYIGSKLALLDNIESVINENTTGKEQVFCDLFSGTASVAKHFKHIQMPRVVGLGRVEPGV